MKKIITFIGIVLLLFGCRNQEIYHNKEHYIISVGETVHIYYTTNSCCYPCVSNQFELNHISLIDNNTVSKESSDCAGCNYVGELVFMSTSIGIDTIELKILPMNVSCDSNKSIADKFIVEIK